MPRIQPSANPTPQPAPRPTVKGVAVPQERNTTKSRHLRVMPTIDPHTFEMPIDRVLEFMNVPDHYR